VREVVGDIWEAHALGHWVVVTTNGVVRKDGACVMGRGVAKEAAQRFPWLPVHLGDRIRDAGNHVHCFSAARLFTFPVKHRWNEPADPTLIARSAGELRDFVADLGGLKRAPEMVCLVRPGCGNGRLRWEDVKPLLSPILDDDRFIVVNRE
jgi:hypothetical protein